MGNHNSGPRPLPTALKVLKGVVRRDRLNPDEPKSVDGPVVKPVYLSALAAKVWDELAPCCLAMGTLTAADIAPFARMCELEVTARMASEGKGMPSWKNQREERESAVALARFYDFFGMTPSGRSRIRVPKKAPDSKWEAVRA